MDQMGCVVQQPTALMERFVNAVEVALFQVTTAAVDQLRRSTAGAGGKIAFVDEGDTQAAQHRIESNTRAGDAAAENEQVEGPVGQRFRHPFHATALRSHASNLRTVWPRTSLRRRSRSCKGLMKTAR